VAAADRAVDGPDQRLHRRRILLGCKCSVHSALQLRTVRQLTDDECQPSAEISCSRLQCRSLKCKLGEARFLLLFLSFLPSLFSIFVPS